MKRIMVVISGFYESITARDTALYLRTLWLSLLIVLAVALTKARPASSHIYDSQAKQGYGATDLLAKHPHTPKQALKAVCVESLALQYRAALVRRLQRLYFIPPHGHKEQGQPVGGAYGLLVGSPPTTPPQQQGPRGPVDNPDQRVAADADAFTTKLAAVLGQVLAVPALIVYCA